MSDALSAERLNNGQCYICRTWIGCEGSTTCRCCRLDSAKIDELVYRHDALLREKQAVEVLVNPNGSFSPLVYDQILIQGACGVSGHFRFQQNGSSCLMCQKDQARETTLAAAEARVKELETKYGR